MLLWFCNFSGRQKYKLPDTPLLNSFNRARLTMHTAFERKDNADPAAVTALSVSRDHRTVYVGDEKGRVWSWAVSSKPGKGK